MVYVFIEFYYPLGLLAALGFGFPFALHIWVVKRRRVLQVGSVKLFGNTKKPRIQQLRIKNWPLLIIRCIIIILLAALLAEPYVNTSERETTERGWVLLGAQHESLLDAAQRRLIDSLLANGYTLHAFEPEFRKMAIQTANDTVSPAPDQFALIHQLNELLPANFPVVIFSRPQINQLIGDIPTTFLALSWYAFAADSANGVRFVTRAWKTAMDSIAIVAGTSNSLGTRFERLIIKDDGREEGIQFNVAQGRAMVKFPEQASWITVEDSPFSVQFATDSSLPDRQYLESLLDAFGEMTGMRMTVDTYTPATPCDLLFDFTDAGVADAPNMPKTVFRYMPGDAIVQQDNHIVQNGTTTNRRKPEIHQLVVAQDDTAATVWTDAYGKPVLTRGRDLNGWRYQFYCRFNPQWTDLVWSEEMVNSLIPLLISPDTPLLAQSFHTHAMDEQALPGPIMLEQRPKIAIGVYEHAKHVAIASLLIWLALLTFAIERIMTHWQKRKEADG